MNTEKKVSRTYFILSVLAILFLGIGIFLAYKGFNDTEKETITYDEDNSVHYKVFLKENNFFDSEYLDEGGTYITNLINYIAVSYKYNIKFDDDISGSYTYYMGATVEADKTNNEAGTYWSKDYKLSEEKTVDVSNQTEYTILENINVDYNKFNNILNEFKESVGVALEGKISVYLIVKNNLTNEKFGNQRLNVADSKFLLSMPLSELAVDGTVTVDNKNDSKAIVKEEKKNPVLYLIIKLLGAVSIFVSIYFLTVMVKLHKVVIERNMYEVTKKRILTTYDSIIVNVNSNPNLDDLNVIYVENFAELIDAHSEIRMPINFYEDLLNNTCYFTLISEKNAWQYILKSTKKYKKRVK